MEIYFLFFIFLLGLIVGSFLNVVIYWIESTRLKKGGEEFKNLPALPRGRKFEIKNSETLSRESLSGRSFCPHCKHQLSFLDLFPVFSWIFLGGKCRYCKEKISIQYPVVELLTGFIFVLTFYFADINIQTLDFSILNAYYLILATLTLLIVNCFLLIVFIYDLKHKIIPDKIIYPAILLVIGHWSLVIGQNGPFIIPDTLYLILNTLLPAIAAGGFFYLIAMVSDGRWMGGGDIKLAFLMGLLLGWPNILVGLGLGFVLGAVVGIALLVLDKAKKNSEIPFGPFLITGTWIALFFGTEVVQWYIKTVGL